jgi:hypothetical protein
MVLTFERGHICISAQSEDDQVVFLDEVPEAASTDVSSRAPWKAALGRNCLWSWSLTNHTGHVDGTQLLFAAPPEPDALVQLLVTASQLDVHVVGDPLPVGMVGGAESGA